MFFAALFYNVVQCLPSWPCAERSVHSHVIASQSPFIHYSALPNGVWLAIESLSSATKSFDSGKFHLFADGCDLLLATSTFVFAFLHPVLLVFSCCPHMVSNSRCIASQVLLKRLPSHPLPNIFGGNFGVSGGDHAPSLRFAQLENLSSVFLLWVFATASRHVEGSLKSLPACSFVYPSSSARPFCVFFLLPRCNWQDRSLQTVSLALMGYHLHRVF